MVLARVSSPLSPVAPIQIVAGFENALDKEERDLPRVERLSRNCRKSREKNVFLFYAIYNSKIDKDTFNMKEVERKFT